MPQQQMVGQPIYPVAPQPLLTVPHGMGEAQQQFGTAAPMPYQGGIPARQRTMINR
jgi:hypothetical protein